MSHHRFPVLGTPCAFHQGVPPRLHLAAVIALAPRPLRRISPLVALALVAALALGTGPHAQEEIGPVVEVSPGPVTVESSTITVTIDWCNTERGPSFYTNSLHQPQGHRRHRKLQLCLQCRDGVCRACHVDGDSHAHQP